MTMLKVAAMVIAIIVASATAQTAENGEIQITACKYTRQALIACV